MNANQEPNFIPESQFSRRDFLKLLKLSGLGLLLAGTGYFSMGASQADLLEIKKVKLALPRLPARFSGFSIAQVSDFHMGGWMNRERLKKVLDTVIAAHPDLVALTGDFVYSSDANSTRQGHLDEMEAELTALSAHSHTLAVPGNHDHWSGMGVRAILDMLRRAGVQPLVNDVQTISLAGESLVFAGIDDLEAGEPDFPGLLARLPQKACAILLAHEPDFADESARSGRFDLQLSGHSHGGQVTFPLIGAPVLPVLGRKYPAGLYQVGNMLQYTNRGVGMVAPFIRLNCPPEITIFTLEAA